MVLYYHLGVPNCLGLPSRDPPIAHLGYRLLLFLKIPTGSHRLSGPDQLARNPAPLSALLEGPPAPLPLWLHEPVEKDRFSAL